MQQHSNQPQLKVRVSTLEKFRRYMASGEDDQYDNEASLIESLEGKFEGNDKTRLGSAFHKIVELPKVSREIDGNLLVDINKDDQTGDPKVFVPSHIVDIALGYKAAHPLMVSEVPFSKVYHTGKYSITVYGKMDGLEGARGRDMKLKFGRPTPTDYMASYQWRFYGDMAGIIAFDYDVFEVKFFDRLTRQGDFYLPMATTGRDKAPRQIQMIPHEPITCVPYTTMHQDCVQLITEFLDYIENRNFFHLLKQVPYETAIL